MAALAATAILLMTFAEGSSATVRPGHVPHAVHPGHAASRHGQVPLDEPVVSEHPPAATPGAPAGLIDEATQVPDPAVLVDGTSDYLYSGGNWPGQAIHVPAYRFTSLDHLPAPTDALPVLPPGTWDWVWAPDVTKAGGRYVLWFTSSWLSITNPLGVANECIGVATATDPLGPFTPEPDPVICQTWGSIDPRTFTDADGQTYLLWKGDTNSDTAGIIPTPFYSQKLAADGTTLEGAPTQIAVADQPWEQSVIEAPDMVTLGGQDELFFAGNQSDSPYNGIGMMPCAGPLGPCTDSAPGPFLGSNDQGQGPGEESLYQQGGVTWLLYSPTFTLPLSANRPASVFRPLAVARVAWDAQGPYLSQFGGAVPGTPSPAAAETTGTPAHGAAPGRHHARVAPHHAGATPAAHS